MPELNLTAVKLEPISSRYNQKEAYPTRHMDLEGKYSLNASSNCQTNASLLDEARPPVEDTIPSASHLFPAPLCRQFWKAGNYEDTYASGSCIQSNKSSLHVHPRFLHSNATSHKWAFGAMAELFDNAIDEIQNGATFVIVDKISNPRDGSPALLIQDDGSGMDPGVILRCMSFGFSDKSKAAIGQYGNGFKTSTMRLGADVIVYSRHTENRKTTQSIGLLSYTYLSRTGLNRIVVPMVHYELNKSTGKFEPLQHCDSAHFLSNLSILLQWSPFSTEEELLKQFGDILTDHGTKVIVYNLWETDDGNLELDFDTDPEDIRLYGSNCEASGRHQRLKTEEHIGSQFRYSLRVYLSILYLRIPQNFRMILCGRDVQHHNIANDLKFIEFIVYKPQTGGTEQSQVITTIGFLKEAPEVNIHGFNVYHKNRLILPFWQVVSYLRSRGRGIVGILEANFVQPTHNKQDFERTSLFQKLETRLKDMTWEYWDFHCGLIGYHITKKLPPQKSPHDTLETLNHAPLGSAQLNNSPRIVSYSNAHPHSHGAGVKRTQPDFSSDPGCTKRRAGVGLDNVDIGNNMPIYTKPGTSAVKGGTEVESIPESMNLQRRCLEHERTLKELKQTVVQLTKELEVARIMYARMSSELKQLDIAM